MLDSRRLSCHRFHLGEIRSGSTGLAYKNVYSDFESDENEDIPENGKYMHYLFHIVTKV